MKGRAAEATGKSVLGPLLALLAGPVSFVLVVPAFLGYADSAHPILVACLVWGTASLATVAWVGSRLFRRTARSPVAHVALLSVQGLIAAGFFGGALDIRSAPSPNGKRTDEARRHLRYLYQGAVAYFEAEHTNRQGFVLERQFPNSVGLTPAAAPCQVGQRNEPRESDWKHPSWQALSFAMGDPFFYRYEFISRGTGQSSEFTARAYGDLDCDGVYSTF